MQYQCFVSSGKKTNIPSKEHHCFWGPDHGSRLILNGHEWQLTASVHFLRAASEETVPLQSGSSGALQYEVPVPEN